ncbi:hypothetical protein BDZ94DRAFT_1323637 [Collybia nuda]|uniref:Uncharacterized protein n=1 Tax=Collybia nuda TaxID=64659 RepID=A0A9P5Y1J9_9AGAR|nr:hypothetical protein BDZ94DRAFT_1323637 [Collybia nuda]
MSASSIILIAIFITTIVNTAFFFMIRELGPLSRERVRREWGREIQRHEAVRAAWVVEAREHEKQRSAMVVERHSWQVERIEKRRELNELQQMIERDQHDWDIKEKDRQREWAKQRIEYEKEVEKRRQRENEELEEQERKLNELHQMIERDRSDWEVEKWDREREWQKRQQDYEKKMDEKRRRKDAERRKREEDERGRAGIHWEDLLPSQSCLGYGKRKYIAKLVGIPDGQHKLSVCRQTEAEIHAEWMKPESCEDRGFEGVWAKWVVDFQEPTCTTWWSNLIDKGCTAPGSHLRRYEQHLENIHGGDDWKVMCTTSPTDFHDHHFDTPTSCANWGKYGIFGYWEVNDSSC